MEDKKMLNDVELDKVSGGFDLHSYYNFVECKECGTTVQASKIYDKSRHAYRYTCCANSSHVWYEET